MSPKLRKILFGLAILILIILGWMFARNARPVFTVLLQRANPLQIILLILISLCSFPWEVFRYNIYVKQISQSISFSKLYHTIMTTLAVSYGIPMNLGIPARVLLLKKMLGIDYLKGGSLVVLDGIIGYSLTGIIAFIGAIKIAPNYAIKIGIMIILFVTAFVFLYLLSSKAMKLRTSKVRKAFEKTIKNLGETRALLSPIIISYAILLFIVGFFFSALRMKFILLILGINLSIIQMLYVSCISYTLATISMIPFGIGVKEASLVFLLSAVGVPKEIGILMSFIERVLTTGLGLGLGLISANVLGIKHLKTEDLINQTSTIKK